MLKAGRSWAQERETGPAASPLSPQGRLPVFKSPPALRCVCDLPWNISQDSDFLSHYQTESFLRFSSACRSALGLRQTPGHVSSHTPTPFPSLFRLRRASFPPPSLGPSLPGPALLHRRPDRQRRQTPAGRLPGAAAAPGELSASSRRLRAPAWGWCQRATDLRMISLGPKVGNGD